ncbi:U-scoloptoxin(16)-Er13a-like [Periplaneta americana]|uniref:U-scoloptoxin(16)-Er13a-like n=1 Tax=Periplaneta americana TaxID=6978 RepID=UPI0037E91F70
MVRTCVCMLLMLCSVTFLQSRVEAAAALAIVPENPDHPGKCYDEDTKKAYAPGESWYPAGQCSQSTCRGKQKDGYHIVFVSCGVVARPHGKPCELQTDESKNYPDCCPRYVCN